MARTGFLTHGKSLRDLPGLGINSLPVRGSALTYRHLRAAGHNEATTGRDTDIAVMGRGHR